LWSLSYEFQIYLALPFLFLARVASGKRAFVIALLAAVPLCMAARASFALSGLSWQMIYMTSLVRPESTIVGILIALGMTQKIPLWVMVIMFMASVAGLLFLPDIYSRYGQVTVYLNSAIFAGALLHLALHAPLLATVLRFALVAYLGRISFGLYIFHLFSGRWGRTF
jgi:peptidoglycan/LPS O-acetylase OafA/YrhL